MSAGWRELARLPSATTSQSWYFTPAAFSSCLVSRYQAALRATRPLVINSWRPVEDRGPRIHRPAEDARRWPLPWLLDGSAPGPRARAEGHNSSGCRAPRDQPHGHLGANSFKPRRVVASRHRSRRICAICSYSGVKRAGHWNGTMPAWSRPVASRVRLQAIYAASPERVASLVAPLMNLLYLPLGRAGRVDPQGLGRCRRADITAQWDARNGDVCFWRCRAVSCTSRTAPTAADTLISV